MTRVRTTLMLLLGLGALLVLSQDLPPGPTLLYRTSFAPSAAEGHQVVNLVLEFAPGAWTPFHSHGGEGIVTVLEGELTHRPEDGEEATYGPGESFLETPGHPHMAGNDTDALTRVLFTILLPDGADITQVLGD
jgi:quercetin dioxygenase-like cupin family protein